MRSRRGPARSAIVADEFLAHAARAARRARGSGARNGARRASSSCCTTGAASPIAYRRRLIDSPSYTLNHEEVEKALEEGIRFAEGLTPLARRRRRARRGDGRCRSSLQQHDGDGVWHEVAAVDAAGAHHPGRRRHAAEHGARARRRRALSRSTASTSGVLDEAGQPVQPCSRRLAKPAQPRGADANPSRWTALHRASSATCIRRSSATSSRRWPAPSRATRSCRAMLAQGRAGIAARAMPSSSTQLERRVARDRASASSG